MCHWGFCVRANCLSMRYCVALFGPPYVITKANLVPVTHVTTMSRLTLARSLTRSLWSRSAMSTLRASLEKHNQTFESLLSLIPAKYYLPHDDEDQQGASRYHKNKKKQQAPKQAIKEASKKARREKLDPANNKTVLDLQHSTSKGKHKAPTLDDSDGEAISSELDIHMDDSDPEDDPAPIVPLPQSESIETLRAKLHAKIEAMRIKKHGEERRLQRAAMRERRRKETKEKIRKEKESKGKSKNTAPPTKSQLLVPDGGAPSHPERDPRSRLTNVQFSSLADDKLKTSSNPSQAEREGKGKRQKGLRKEQLAANMAAKQKKRADNIASRNEKRKERQNG
ncbi:SURF6-domain-containing protein, partial [Lactarius sanguifluus]